MIGSHPSKPVTPSVDRPNPEPVTAFDEIIEVYLRDVDRTLIRANLTLSPEERLRKLEEFVDFLEKSRRARQMAE